MSISARFEVAFSRFLAPEGNVEQELPAFARERDAVLRLYRAMVLTRSFDTRAVALQRTGRLGTYASSLGQEAVAVGAGDAMVAGLVAGLTRKMPLEDCARLATAFSVSAVTRLGRDLPRSEEIEAFRSQVKIVPLGISQPQG